ncbi:MAG TPA: PAC2 family protein, partial [archaeon]|nr:PAC2 family protein [archaeon]
FVVVGDAQPSLPPQGFFNAQHLFSRDLAGLLKKLGCSRVFTVAGVPDPERAFKGPEVNIVATTKDLFKELKGDYKKYGAGLPINGAAGLVMQYSSVLGMQSACLIGSTSPQVQYPDFGSAAAVLSVLEKSVGMGLDEKMLGKKAKEFEKKLQEMVSVSQQQPVMEIPRGYEFPKQQEEDKFGGKYPGYIT